MKSEKWSGYDKYVVLADQCKYLSGGYEGFVNLREIMETLTLMCSKQQNTYTYNGEMYVSKLTPAEIQKIQSAFDFGTYNNSIEKLKYIFMDIGDRLF